MPSEVNPALGIGFDSVISNALNSDPASRFVNAEEFANALRSVEPSAQPRQMKTGNVSAKPEAKVTPATPQTSATSAPPGPHRQSPLASPGPLPPGPRSTGLPKPAEREKRFPWNIVGFSAGLIFLLGGGIWFLTRTPAEKSPVKQVALSMPTGVQVLQTSTSSVFLDWDDLPGNDGSIRYKIYRDGYPVATTEVSDYQDTELSPDKKYVYRVASFHSGGRKESLRSPEVGAWTDESNAARLIRLSNGLRLLYPHCPELEEEIRGSKLLRFLVIASSEMYEVMEMIRTERPEMAAEMESEDFVERVSGVYYRARLPKPRRDVRSGTLVGWTKDTGSESPAREFLPGFSGDGRDIVSIAGSIETGIALKRDGSVDTWGTSQSPPAGLRNVVAVDSENGHFAVLTGSGKVYVWGNGALSQSAVDSWKFVSHISLGQNHILAVTEDFEVLAAGASDFGQIKIPKLDRHSEPIVAVEALGDRSHAITASGRLYSWGKFKPSRKLSFPVPRIMQSSGNSLFVSDRGDYDIYKIDQFGHEEKLDLSAAQNEILHIPQFSPDEKLFAYHRGSSRWNLSNESGLDIDMAYWQETARGAVDMILGNSGRFLAVVPRASDPVIPTASTRDTVPTAPAVKPVPMTHLDDIAVPEVHAYRNWTPRARTPFRARVKGVNGNRAVFRLSDGTEKGLPVSDLSSADQAFVRSWKPVREISLKRYHERLAKLTVDEFLEQAGYHRVDFTLDRNKPHVEIEINGVKAGLVLDTGASTTIVSARIADEADISLAKGEYALTWQGRVMVYEGKARTLKMGGLNLTDVEIGATEIKARGHDGLVGIDILQTGRSALDFGRKQLIFQYPQSRDTTEFKPRTIYRTWTSHAGSTLEGVLVPEQSNSSTVVLRLEDGSTKSFATTAFGQRDLEYLDLRRVYLDFEKGYLQYRDRLEIGDFLWHHTSGWEEIKTTMQGDSPIVDVVVDGRKFEFFLDTGAATTMLSIASAQSLDREPRDMRVVGAGSGIEGNRVPIYADDFTSLQVGNRILHDCRLHVYDFGNMVSRRYSGTRFEGVLGNDLLIRWKAFVDLAPSRILIPKER